MTTTTTRVTSGEMAEARMMRIEGEEKTPCKNLNDEKIDERVKFFGLVEQKFGYLAEDDHFVCKARAHEQSR